MAGIYVHIPFCKQACTYCDFHFSTSVKNKAAMVDAIIAEAALRKEYLFSPGYSDAEKIETLYFGGGTPSLLSAEELKKLVTAFRQMFDFHDSIELTFEANPDDLTTEKLAMLTANGINRLSIGIQSFDNDQLKWMNRAHRSDQSIAAVKAAQLAGIRNISIDLIYGLPGLTPAGWKKEIARAVALDIKHISAYCLTVEPNTALGAWVKKGKAAPVDEAAAASQFEILVDELAAAGFEQYEVSNFSPRGFHSKHNTSYWQGTPYLGLGPSAHSFKLDERSWNVANNAIYIKAIAKAEPPQTVEHLSKNDQMNELIMTGLRTKWGLDLQKIKNRFDIDLTKMYAAEIDKLLSTGKAELKFGILTLTRKGLFAADGIAAGFFDVD